MRPLHPLFLPAAAHAFALLTVLVLSAAVVGMGMSHRPWFAFAVISVLVLLQVLLIAGVSMRLVSHPAIGIPLFLGGLALVTLLMVLPSIDMQTRGNADAIRADRPVKVGAPFDETDSARQRRLRLGGNAIASVFVPPGR